MKHIKLTHEMTDILSHTPVFVRVVKPIDINFRDGYATPNEVIEGISKTTGDFYKQGGCNVRIYLSPDSETLSSGQLMMEGWIFETYQECRNRLKRHLLQEESSLIRLETESEFVNARRSNINKLRTKIKDIDNLLKSKAKQKNDKN